MPRSTDHTGEWLKRGFDILFSSVGLLVSAPLWVVFAVAIKAEDGGPVFYRQTRVGLRGKQFQVFKFRSMYADAETRSGAVWASKSDPRITPVGRWL